MSTIVEHEIEGGGGTRLHAIEAGQPDARAIVFIHGFSQCALAWMRQLQSELARDHRLIAIDLRGHGLSARPEEGYADSRLWADDIDAVIGQLRLRTPILCGWSYGPLVILDYLRQHGQAAIGGLHFVGGITRLGSEQAMSALSPEFAAIIPGLLSTDTWQTVAAFDVLMRLCFDDLPAEDRYRMLGYSLSVAPGVRHAMFSRVLDNDDLLRTIRKPVLITHGSKDAIVRPAVVDRHRALMPQAQVHLLAGSGHAPFWDDCEAFNRRLRTFAASLDATVARAP